MKEVRIFRQEKKRRKFNVEYVDLELVLWSLASKDTTLPSIPRRQIVVQPTQLARTPLVGTRHRACVSALAALDTSSP